MLLFLIYLKVVSKVRGVQRIVHTFNFTDEFCVRRTLDQSCDRRRVFRPAIIVDRRTQNLASDNKSNYDWNCVRNGETCKLFILIMENMIRMGSFVATALCSVLKPLHC